MYKYFGKHHNVSAFIANAVKDLKFTPSNCFIINYLQKLTDNVNDINAVNNFAKQKLN